MKIFQKSLKSAAIYLAVGIGSIHAAPVSIKVSIDNLAPAGGVALTPVWVGFHNGSFDSYDPGVVSSAALEALAEDGNTAPISADFAATPNGVDGAILGNAPPLIQPGMSGQSIFTLDDGGDNRYFSYASMVLVSNDYFIANGNPLAHDLAALLSGAVDEISFFIGMPGAVRDAGTEINDFSTSAGNGLFPGLPAGQGAPGVGVDENGVVTAVTNPYAGFLNTPPGFDFSALDFSQYPNGIAEVTISAVPVPPLAAMTLPGFALVFGAMRSGRSKKS